MYPLQSQPWLVLLILLPLVSASLIYFRKILSKKSDNLLIDKAATILALFATIGNFALSLILIYVFNPEQTGYQFLHIKPWLSFGMSLKFGVDGISLPFVILTTFIMPICILISIDNIKKNIADYMAAFLLLEGFIIGAFVSIDLVLFYVFFEATLIPMFMIIGIWGSQGEKDFFGFKMPSRIYATMKFFLFTFAGSVLMLIAIAWLVSHFGTSDLISLTNHNISFTNQYYLFIAFFIAFAVKIPMWPFHTWLPDAHVQAPTAGSVVLAAILLKLGGYGFLRVVLPILPDATSYFAPYILILSVIAIIYTSLVALAQSDMKKLIAYTSIAHMGFVTMGIFSLNKQGLDGAMYQMISHGLISAALFICVGVLYNRKHTREISAYGGLYRKMPIFAFLFLGFTMGNVGLPGTSGFIGEILAFLAVFQKSIPLAFFAATGVIFSAMYGLRLYKLVTLGEEGKNKQLLQKLNIIEMAVLSLLFVFMIFFGFYTSNLSNLYNLPINLIITGFK